MFNAMTQIGCNMEKKLVLKSLNPFITCNICKGYLIDATAISECLHTFCKSCLIKHLERNTTCPTCDIVIHHSYPRHYINYDRTMQDIVFKLVPGLSENERDRERQFYKTRGLPCPKDIIVGEDTKEEKEESSQLIEDVERAELITVCLECFKKINSSHFQRIFIRVPTKTSVLFIKKFVARKLFDDASLYCNFDIVCNLEVLEKDDTLKYVYLMKWKFDVMPLVLQCQPNCDL